MTKKYILTADDVVDNLTSTDQSVPLSANQGKVLADRTGNATTSSKGIVQVGSGLSVTDGVISVSGGSGKLYVKCTTTTTSIEMGTTTNSFETQAIEFDTPFSVSPTLSFTKSATAPNFLESNGEFEGLTAVTFTVSFSAWLTTTQGSNYATFTLVDSNGSTVGSKTIGPGSYYGTWVTGSITFTYTSPTLTYTLSSSYSNKKDPSVSIVSHTDTVYA